MFIVDLECESGHAFEGWYDSAEELRALEARDEVTCPLCDARAHRLPSASRISTATTRGEKRAMTSTPAPRAPGPAPATPTPDVPLEVQKALGKLVQHVRATHEDVGEEFATKALAIHKGEEEARPIRGTSTAEEEERLTEEGVPFAKLPIPDIENN